MKKQKTLIKTPFTQAHIAQTLEISQPTVSNWLKMKAKPSNMAQKVLQQHFPELAEAIEIAWKN